MEKSTTAELKKANKKNIFQFIYQKQKTSKQEIASILQLSLPTVGQNLKELEYMNLITKNGHFESTGGRKANAITFISSAKIAIGLEILKESFEVVAINLYGDIIKSEKKELHFINDDNYFQEVCGFVNQFISSLHVASKRILGLGIVLQGLISSDATSVTYGKILDCTGLTIESLTKYILYPCSMIHDAEAAATVELWGSSDIKDAIFFHIRSNLSGAIIIDGKFLKGRELKSGIFEHMTIVPSGLPCYCGKRGCVEAYCSLNSLLAKQERIETFFQNLRGGEEYAKCRWQAYLEYLSIAIDNLHMLMDWNIILGGTLAVYLLPEDIKELHRLVTQRTAFPTKREFIKISRCASSPIAIGAALPYIMHYLDTVVE